MEQVQKKIAKLNKEFQTAAAGIKLDELNRELSSIQSQMTKPGFWENPQAAQNLSKNQAGLLARIKPWLDLKKEIEELYEISEVSDDSMAAELSAQTDNLKKSLDELKLQLRFQGLYDDHDVILGIYAGAGGTDAQDWARMLMRMYIRWAESNQVSVATLDQSDGEEAGIKSATIELSGSDFLYGKLAGEHGVHRLVRLSPYNADNLRQTSFARVDVLPKIEQPEEVEIDDKDLKIDVYRAGGHGGQSVNTTDSAVRVTHVPTGITVSIQNERSQLQNKETAMAILRSRLAALQLEQHASTISELKGPNQSAQWGNQIRNYVLHPYKQVKDLRTGYESAEPNKVLEGQLNPLIEAWLERFTGAKS